MAERRRPRPARAAPGTVERGLADLARAERRAVHRRAAATARAVQDERFRRMEQDVAELRGRVHGLLFLVLGAVISQVILRLLT